MNAATLLCRNFIRYHANTWWHKHVMHGSRLHYRLASQYTQTSRALTHKAAEKRKRKEEEIIDEERTRVLKDQVNNGQVVRIALGQLNPEDKQTVETEKLPPELLNSCFTVDKILELIEGRKLSTEDGVEVLKRIRDVCTEGSDAFTRDEHQQVMRDMRFKNFISELTMRKHAPHTILAILSPLLDISGKDTTSIVFLQKELMKQLDTMQFSTLFHVLVNHKKHQETETRKAMYSFTQSVVLRRWVEISEPEQLLVIMNNSGRKSRDLCEKLHAKALSLTANMDESQLVRLLKELSLTKQRNIPLLRNVFYHLKKVGIRADISQSKDLLHSLGNLNVYDKELLRDICTTLNSNSHTMCKADARTLSSIIFSLMTLKYKYIELIDSITDILMSNQEGVDLTEEEIVKNTPTDVLTAVIVSCATLNHMPKSWKSGNLLNIIVEKIKNSGEVSDRNWLNTVHALVTLDAADESAMSSIINDPDKEDWNNLTANKKLHDINFSAKYEMKSYEGLYLPEHFSKEKGIMENPSKDKRLLFTNLVETLNKILPGHKYFKSNFDHPRGLNVGIHMVVNGKGEPQPVDDFPVDKDLPESMHWIAVEPLDFGDMTRCTPGPTGFKSLHIRHLKCLGYRVVEVPHTEWIRLTTEVKKVGYITKKIEESIS